MLQLDFGHGVLVVDDHFVVRTAVAQTLLSAGYQVVLAESGDRAVEYLRLRHYDLVVTEELMTVEGGLSLVRYLKQHHPGLPVLVTTGQPTGPAAGDATGERPVGVLAKPFTPGELRKVVETLLQARSDAPEATF